MTGQPENTRRDGARGFRRAASLLSRDIRAAGESRGFAVSRVLTHWEEIAGADLAAATRPVKVVYGRGGLGATLTLLTNGAQAPIVEMQKEALRERINACYGYAAISRIRLTQTAPDGFSEGAAKFQPKDTTDRPSEPGPRERETADRETAEIGDPDLKRALALLGANVHSKANK